MKFEINERARGADDEQQRFRGLQIRAGMVIQHLKIGICFNQGNHTMSLTKQTFRIRLSDYPLVMKKLLKTIMKG